MLCIRLVMTNLVILFDNSFYGDRSMYHYYDYYSEKGFCCVCCLNSSCTEFRKRDRLKVKQKRKRDLENSSPLPAVQIDSGTYAIIGTPPPPPFAFPFPFPSPIFFYLLPQSPSYGFLSSKSHATSAGVPSPAAVSGSRCASSWPGLPRRRRRVRRVLEPLPPSTQTQPAASHLPPGSNGVEPSGDRLPAVDLAGGRRIRRRQSCQVRGSSLRVLSTREPWDLTGPRRGGRSRGVPRVRNPARIEDKGGEIPGEAVGIRSGRGRGRRGVLVVV